VPGGWKFTNHWIRKPGDRYEGPPGLTPPPDRLLSAAP
jgi:hypothetical protein